MSWGLEDVRVSYGRRVALHGVTAFVDTDCVSRTASTAAKAVCIQGVPEP